MTAKSIAKRRAVSFSKGLADRICLALLSGQPLKDICEGEGMPVYSTVMKWNSDNVGGFREMLASANALKYIAWEDECVQIADDSRNDWMERLNRKTGEMETVSDSENIARSKLRIETRMKIMSKRSDLYSDRSTVEHTGAGGGPIEIDHLSPAEEQRIVNFFMMSNRVSYDVDTETAGVATPELPAEVSSSSEVG